MGPISVDNGGSTGDPRSLAVAIGLAALSGVVLGLAFRVPAFAPLAWLGLTPLLIAIHRASLPRAALAGLVAGIIFFGVLLYWAAIFGALALVGLVAYMSLWMVLFAIGVARLSKLDACAGYLRILAIPSLWVLIEYIRSAGQFGFPWGVLGYSQQPIVPIARFAALGGVFGLGWALVFVNATLAELFDERQESRPRRFAVALAATAVVFVAVVVGGMSQMGPLPAPSVRVAGVQPSIDQWAKFDEAQAGTVTRVLNRLSRRALRTKPDLLIWPETVVPFSGLAGEPFVKKVEAEASRADADFLFGAFVKVPGGTVSNSAVLATPDGRESRYGKVHLVPFGEYVPLRPLIGNIGLLKMVTLDQTPARQPVLLEASKGPLGVVICFESADDGLVRQVVNSGAGLLVVITNDGWFEKTAASEQHFQVTTMRAIENGIHVVQVSNNGISGIIDPRGRVLARTGLWDRTVMSGRAGLGSHETAYRRFGSWPVLVWSLVWLVAAVLTGWRSLAFDLVE